MKIGAITFALTVLGGFMANAAVSGCSSSRATAEPATPELKVRSTEMPSTSASPKESDEEYLPATKVGTFGPRRKSK